ncbi:hypothetical protein V8G54_018963 [Vigna mungo]|uniref:Uncharacterized protein n=1 Tax=Vigna mungo TaxID=3915 RepID=A0AAQ3NAJ4_VIGMU
MINIIYYLSQPESRRDDDNPKKETVLKKRFWSRHHGLFWKTMEKTMKRIRLGQMENQTRVRESVTCREGISTLHACPKTNGLEPKEMGVADGSKGSVNGDGPALAGPGRKGRLVRNWAQGHLKFQKPFRGSNTFSSLQHSLSFETKQRLEVSPFSNKVCLSGTLHAATTMFGPPRISPVTPTSRPVAALPQTRAFAGEAGYRHSTSILPAITSVAGTTTSLLFLSLGICLPQHPSSSPEPPSTASPLTMRTVAPLQQPSRHQHHGLVVVVKEKEAAATESTGHSYRDSPARKILSSPRIRDRCHRRVAISTHAICRLGRTPNLNTLKQKGEEGSKKQNSCLLLLTMPKDKSNWNIFKIEEENLDSGVNHLVGGLRRTEVVHDLCYWFHLTQVRDLISLRGRLMKKNGGESRSLFLRVLLCRLNENGDWCCVRRLRMMVLWLSWNGGVNELMEAEQVTMKMLERYNGKMKEGSILAYEFGMGQMEILNDRNMYKSPFDGRENSKGRYGMVVVTLGMGKIIDKRRLPLGVSMVLASFVSPLRRRSNEDVLSNENVPSKRWTMVASSEWTKIKDGGQEGYSSLDAQVQESYAESEKMEEDDWLMMEVNHDLLEVKFFFWSWFSAIPKSQITSLSIQNEMPLRSSKTSAENRFFLNLLRQSRFVAAKNHIALYLSQSATPTANLHRPFSQATYRNWAWWASVETGLVGQAKLGLWARLGLWASVETGLMGQHGNWAYGPGETGLGGPIWKLGLWASVELGLWANMEIGLMGQAKLGLWANMEIGLMGQAKLGLGANMEIGLMGQCRTGLMGQYGNWAYGPGETGLMGQHGNWAYGPGETGLGGPIWKLGLWASVELGLWANMEIGLMGQAKLGLGANMEIGLMGQCRTGLMGQYGNWAYGPGETGLGGPIWKLGLWARRNWAWWANVEIELGGPKLGLWASVNWAYGPMRKLGLWANVEIGLGGPVVDWAWWASVETGLMGQCKLGLWANAEIGLMGQCRNWAWWASVETGLGGPVVETGLMGQMKLGLGASVETGLMKFEICQMRLGF